MSVGASGKGKGFEIRTHEVYSRLAQAKANAHVGGTLRHVRVKGASGVEHQVDVYWEFGPAEKQLPIAIECKNQEKGVKLEHARSFSALIEDIGARGHIVSASHIQSGAATFARYKGIGIKRIREPRESDWDGCIQKVAVSLRVRDLHVTGIDVIPVSKTASDEWSDTMLELEHGLIAADLNASIDGSDPVPFETQIERLRRTVEQETPGGHRIEVPASGWRLLRNGLDEPLEMEALRLYVWISEVESAFEVDAMKIVDAVLEDIDTGNTEILYSHTYNPYE